MKIGILSEGKYGERAYNVIGKKFNCDFIKVKYSGEFDDIEIDKDVLEKLKDYDLFITYTTNPDLTYELVRQISKINKNAFVIVGAWKGGGFKKQLESFGNAFCPDLMCEIDEDVLKNYIDKFPQLKGFLKYFGRPKVKIKCIDDKIKDIEILREAPCGSTSETLKEFIGKEFNENTLKNIGLRVQHFCRASKIRLFVDNECKKIKAGEIIVQSVKEGINQ
ncbi:DUF166 domain-containing protein [Methanotorris igneus]|uniref:Thymidylate synthase n=1 Tax=Methanotorris igneus (strain DSM 5666 / JCM 11834 / Kol 5) TaxID=880724 RepID=F6BDY8_METIK|nr:DUF166 family protein [Methanotorris igneus]AEF96699.1 protein of unknown function DUF166 [Methanotorris igneus Kol 5]